MDDVITLSHGAGGEKMDSLIKDLVLRYFGDYGKDAEVPLKALDDAAVVNGIVFTTDSHTVQPVFFPGGDIGSLSVAGTVNDIAVTGARPIALSAALVIEEGFERNKLDRILQSMQKVAIEAEVPIVTGDTKVVERGGLQDIIINTSAVGIRTDILDENLREARRYRDVSHDWLVDSNLRPGDRIILSGKIAEHGIALLSFREGYKFESEIKSDVAPLNKLMESLLKVGGIVTAKDPTRGGIANTLNEFSEKSNVRIEVFEERIPISNDVKSACDMLGIDPLEIGNEGKVIIGVVREKAEDVLKALRRHPLGRDSEIIGEVKEGKGVIMETLIGGKRRIYKPIGDPIPRIC
ncbi:MAG TPA: hydrogenase expression/formation protein HypE [Thermoplasmatales archaeon]|nr:hydrogenase expression/formation protein HypE [Thermoplasmatales archaeon]